MFHRTREDIAAIRSKDPAARSALDVCLSYPGFHAVRLHRVANSLWRHGWRRSARWVSHLSRFLTGIEIHPAAYIGRRVFIDHGMGIVIGETAEVHDDCTIYQGVTLGGTSLERGAKRHPTLERGVIVSAGAKVLGSFTVGEGARVGSNSVVLKAVPPGATAVGIPARIITAETREQREATAQKIGFSAYGLSADIDDPLVQAIHKLLDHSAELDARLNRICAALERQGIDCATLRGPGVDAAAIDRLLDAD
ncbi:MAG: serine O-acetyltransferase [Burkholderiales bacterium]|nr:serine O-acetyltransferase [Burkholderiales bacterium]